MENTLRIYRSNYLEKLLETMGDLLRYPPSSPFEPECIVVQSKGIATWLSMGLGHRFGVWANPDFPHPRQFLQRVIRAAIGEQGDTVRRFTRERLSFAVLSVLPSLLALEEFARLRLYLGDHDENKRFQLARRIAHIFDQYIVYRPELLLAWEEKRAAVPPLTEDDVWQPLLWRAVTELMGSPSPVRLMHDAFGALTRGNLAHPEILPPRVSVFGIVSLPRSYLQMFANLARICPVHFFFTAPTPFYWGDIRSKQEIFRLQGRKIQPGEGLPAEEGNPLLAALGALGRDFHEMLEEEVDYQEPDEELFVENSRPRSLLEQLQEDILQLRCRGAGRDDAPALPFPLGDRSIQIHACHSMLRELEVLQDHLLSLLAGPEPYRPHQILVMTPDISRYAPLISAVFDRDPVDPRFIPYQVADQRDSGNALLIDAFFSLLAVMRSRFRISDLLMLLENEAMLRRFHLAAADLPSLRNRLASSGIRWGIDAEHRQLHDQPPDRQNTWRFGLDRLLLGYALLQEGGRTFGDLLPFDDIEGKDAESLGAFIHLGETLFACRRELAVEKTLRRWQAVVNRLLDTFWAPAPEDLWQLQKIRQAMAELADESRDAGYNEPVSSPQLEELLREKLASSISAHGYLEGGVTFCEMLPMRSIPFPVVCILGLNDGIFPRENVPLTFDLIARFPQKGDRSQRHDDLYLFLEALLSVRKKLWLSFEGFSSRDNAPRPPSVMVDQLIDVIAESYYLDHEPSPDHRRRIADLLVIRHPLQPVSARYFAGSDPGLFSYAGQFCRAARVLEKQEVIEPRFLSSPLPPDAGEGRILELAELQRFFSLPVRWFLQKRLNLYLEERRDQLEERLPLQPEGLERYQLREEILARWTLEPDELYNCLRGQGKLPLGEAGRFTLEQLRESVDPIARQVERLTVAGRLADFSGTCEFSGIRSISGELASRYQSGLVRSTIGKPTALFLLRSWLEHLFLCAVSPPDQEPVTWLVGQGEKSEVQCLRFINAGSAPRLLDDLVRLRETGRVEPLPFFPKAAYAFASAMKDAKDGGETLAKARTAAGKAFFGDSFSQASFEADSPWVRQLWRNHNPLSPNFVPHEGKPSAGNFEELSLRVFLPLLEHLEVHS